MKLVKFERGEVELPGGVVMSLSVDWSGAEPVIRYFYYRPEAGPEDILGKGTIPLNQLDKDLLAAKLKASPDAAWMLGSQPADGKHTQATEAFKEASRLARDWALDNLQ